MLLHDAGSFVSNRSKYLHPDFQLIKLLLVITIILCLKHPIKAVEYRDEDTNIHRKAYELYQEKQYQKAYSLLISTDALLQSINDSATAHVYYLAGRFADRIGKGKESVKWHLNALYWRMKIFMTIIYKY